MNGEGRIHQLLERGRDALQAGDLAEAQALLRQVLEQDPRNAEAWYAMAWTLPTVGAVAWCLERVLAIDPDHPEAAEFLRQARTEPDRFAARWLEGDLKRLGEALGRVSAKVRDAERLADEVDRRLTALERRAGDGGEVAEGPAARESGVLGQGVPWAPGAGTRAHWRGGGPAAGTSTALDQGTPASEGRPGEGYPEGLHDELGLLWRTLVRQGRDLRRIERRVERTYDLIAGALTTRGSVTMGRQRVSIFAFVMICLGLLLLILGAVQAYPYVHSRFSSLMGAAGLLTVEGLKLDGPVIREDGAPVALAVEQAVGTGAPSPRASPTRRASSTPGRPPTAEDEDVVAPTVTHELPSDPDPSWSFDSVQPQLTAVPSPTPEPATVAPPTVMPVDIVTPSPIPWPTPQPTAPPPPMAAPASLPPSRIVISKVGVDARVAPVAFQSALGEWEVPMWGAAGWHEGSAALGVPGNTVLNGHNTTGGEVFRDLYRLEPGDAIVVYSSGVAFRYAVSRVLILPELGQPREVRERNASYLLPTQDERLTLVTCHPYGSLRNRLIVIARPM